MEFSSFFSVETLCCYIGIFFTDISMYLFSFISREFIDDLINSIFTSEFDFPIDDSKETLLFFSEIIIDFEMDDAVSSSRFLSHLYQEGLSFLECSAVWSNEEWRISRSNLYSIYMVFCILSLYLESRKIDSE